MKPKEVSLALKALYDNVVDGDACELGFGDHIFNPVGARVSPSAGKQQQGAAIAGFGRMRQHRYALDHAFVDPIAVEIVELVGGTQHWEPFFEVAAVGRKVVEQMKTAREPGYEDVVVRVQLIDDRADRFPHERHLRNEAPCHDLKDIDEDSERRGGGVIGPEHRNGTFNTSDTQAEIMRDQLRETSTSVIDHRDRDPDQRCGGDSRDARPRALRDGPWA